jgi:TP901 family phage tail tape measure protein
MAAPAAVLQVLVTANTAQANAALAKTQAQLQATTASAQKAGASTAAAGSAMNKNIVRGAGGVAAVLGASVVAAAKFEDAFADVRKTVDASPAEFKRMETGLRNLAKEIPVSVDELSHLAGTAGALGIASKDIVGFTKVAAMLGTATDVSAEDAATSLAKLGNVMRQSTVKDFERMGAVLVDLGNKGASTEDEILNMSGRIAGAGKVVGLTAKQVLGLAATLSDAGIRAEMGGSAISQVMLQMQDAVARGGEVLGNFARVSGVTGQQFARIFKTDATQAVGLFAEGLSKVNRQGGSTMQVLEGVQLGERRTRETLLKLGEAQKDVSVAQGIANEAWKKNTALTEEANKRYATTASQFILLKNRVNDVAITIGLALLPAVNDAMKQLGQFAGAGEDIGTTVGNAAGKSDLLGTALQGVGKGLERVINPVGAAKQTVSDLGKVFGFSGDQAEEMDRKIDQIDLKRLSAQFTHFKSQIESQTKAIRQAGISNMQQMVKGMGNTFPELLQKQKALTTMLTSRWKEVREGGVHETKVMAAQMGVHWKNLRDMLRGVADDLQLIVFNTLKSLGVDPASISALVGRTSLIQGKRKGDPGGLQAGGVIVPGSGSGDKVRALLEPGEVVLNRQAVKALGGAGMADSINKAIPRFAKGGPVTGSVIGGAGGARGVMVAGVKADVGAANDLIEKAKKKRAAGSAAGSRDIVELGRALQREGFTVGEHPAFGGVSGVHVAGSYHYRGRALDVNADSMPGGEMANLDRLNKQLMKNPKVVELLWRVANHFDHLHVAMQRGGIVKMQGGGGVPRPAHGKHWAKVLQARSPGGGKVSVDEGATLLWQAGMATGEAGQLARVIPGESGGGTQFGDPRAVSSAGAKGVFQILGSLYPGNLFDPRINAINAMRKWRGAGNSFSPWVAPPSGPAGKILEAMTRPLGAAKGGGKNTPPGSDETDAPAWVPTLPKKITDHINRLAGETGAIAMAGEMADRASTFATAIGGKDEIGWIHEQLRLMEELREVYIGAIKWIHMKIEEYQRRIELAQREILALKERGYWEALHPDKDYPKRYGIRKQKVKDLQEKIAKWKTRKKGFFGLLHSEDGPRAGLGALQGQVIGIDPMATGLNLAAKELWGAFGGDIGTAQSALKSAADAGLDTTNGSAAVDNSEIVRLLQEQNDNLAKEKYVLAESFKVLSQTPYVGSFAQGGMVPGVGPKLATVHGGEMIGQPSPIVILVQDGAVNANRIKAISGRQAEQMARRAGRGRIPGRAGAMG